MRLVFVITCVAIFLTAAVALFIPRKDTVDVVEGPVIASAEKGEFVFRRCIACHAIGENKKLTGPTLKAVINRPSGSVPGYRYSNAMAKLSVVWDEETLSNFLTKPRAMVPGTKMGFGGIKKPQDIRDLLAFLTAEGGLYTAPSQ